MTVLSTPLASTSPSPDVSPSRVDALETLPIPTRMMTPKKVIEISGTVCQKITKPTLHISTSPTP